MTSVQFSCSVVSNSLWPHEPQHTRPPCPSSTEFTQTHVHWVWDAIQLSHPLLSPSPPILNLSQNQFSSVQPLSRVRLCNPKDCITTGSLFPGVYSVLCPLSWWCYLTILSSATLFSFCLQSFPASGSFSISQFFKPGGQSSGASASLVTQG